MTPHPQLAPAVSTSSPASRAPNIRPIGRQMIDRCLRDRAITSVLRSDWTLPGPTLAISSGHLLGVARTLDPSHFPSIDTEILDATLDPKIVAMSSDAYLSEEGKKHFGFLDKQRTRIRRAASRTQVRPRN